MNEYLVFSKYTRDAQIYAPEEAGKGDLGDDNGWIDAEGPMLVLDMQAKSLSEVKERILCLYGEGTLNCFNFYMVKAMTQQCVLE